jgi:hypothetical protein
VKTCLLTVSEVGEAIQHLVAEGFADDLRSDWVHFGEEGSRILAEAVIKRIYEVI